MPRANCNRNNGAIDHGSECTPEASGRIQCVAFRGGEQTHFIETIAVATTDVFKLFLPRVKTRGYK